MNCTLALVKQVVSSNSALKWFATQVDLRHLDFLHLDSAGGMPRRCRDSVRQMTMSNIVIWLELLPWL